MKNSRSFSQTRYSKCMGNAGMAVCFGTARPVTMVSLALTSQNGGQFTPHSFSHILVIAEKVQK